MKSLGVSALLFTALISNAIANRNIMEVLDSEHEALIFRQHLSNASFLSILENEDFVDEITAFIPTNSAIQAFKIRKFEQLVSENKKAYLRNFFTQTVVDHRNLPASAASFSKDNANLFFNHGPENDRMRFYVNEAQVIRKLSRSTPKITVYLIDSVPKFDGLENRKADALYNLENKSSAFRSYDLEKFLNQIRRHDLRSHFDGSTQGTFFIPIGHVPDMTKEAVLAHYIPNKVIFTRQFGKEIFHSGHPNTSISTTNETIISPHYVIKSITHLPEKTRAVTATVRLENIPVRNGVIHFIQSPLAVPTRRIYEYLRDTSENYDRFNLFVETLVQSREFSNELQRAENATFFVPSNLAATHLPKDVWDSFRTNITELQRLLRSHFVPTRSLPQESLKSGSVTAFTAANVSLTLRKDPCSSAGCPNTLMVSCGEINASVVGTEIALQNGVIYIIDRVLGAPSHSLGWKLQHTNQLSTTRAVATKNSWNRILEQPLKQYTFFAPDNEAWKRVENRHPEEYNQIVRDPNHSHDQASRILDRHIILGQYNKDELLKKQRLRTLKGDFVEFNKAGDQATITWNDKTCYITKSDVQATNGLMQIIDCVMHSDDLDASNAPSRATLSWALLSMIVAVNLIGRH